MPTLRLLFVSVFGYKNTANNCNQLVDNRPIYVAYELQTKTYHFVKSLLKANRLYIFSKSVFLPLLTTLLKTGKVYSTCGFSMRSTFQLQHSGK